MILGALGGNMRLPLLTTTMLALACIGATPNADASPLVTISCEKPNGFNIEYGTTLSERVGARVNKQPQPPPTLRGPNEDGYSGKPTFIIDANRKDMTVIWSELPEDVEFRKRAKELNIPQLPHPPATQE